MKRKGLKIELEKVYLKVKGDRGLRSPYHWGSKLFLGSKRPENVPGGPELVHVLDYNFTCYSIISKPFICPGRVGGAAELVWLSHPSKL